MLEPRRKDANYIKTCMCFILGREDQRAREIKQQGVARASGLLYGFLGKEFQEHSRRRSLAIVARFIRAKKDGQQNTFWEAERVGSCRVAAAPRSWRSLRAFPWVCRRAGFLSNSPVSLLASQGLCGCYPTPGLSPGLPGSCVLHPTLPHTFPG